MKNLLSKAMPLAAVVLAVVSFGNQSAIAQGPHGAAGTSILYIYDPDHSGTVAARYVNKFRRLAAYLEQSHTNPNTGVGYVFHGLEGMRLANSQYGIDISDDTNVTDRAVIVLIGRVGSSYEKHTVLGQNAANSFPSGPGWTSYRYNADQFEPPFRQNEVLSSLAVTLLGGCPPSTHFQHWTSRPWINGVFQHELATHTLNLSRSNGNTVLPDELPFPNPCQ